MISAKRFAFLFALVVTSGCASAGSRSGGVTPPQLADPNSHPVYDISTMGDMREFAGKRIDYQIWIGADGVPDASTLRITGAGSPRLEEAVRSWLTTSKFKPAIENGHPVAALYKGYSETRVEVR